MIASAVRVIKGATRLPNTQPNWNMATTNTWNREDKTMLVKRNTNETTEWTPAVAVYWFSVNLRRQFREKEEEFRPSGGDFQGIGIYRSDGFLFGFCGRR